LHSRGPEGRPELATALGLLTARLERRRHEQGEAARRALSQLDRPVALDVDEEVLFAEANTRFGQAATRQERQALLDLVCAWPAIGAAAFLPELVTERWAEDRAGLILTLRFGGRNAARPGRR